MTVISSKNDAATLTLVFVAEFDATPERVWELWEDPRQLEKWWGPPVYPAKFVRHDFEVGGESRYVMTGPEGQIAAGWWRIESLDRPKALTFANGLAGEDSEPLADVPPMAASMTLEDFRGGTRMTVASRFVDTEQMEKFLAMGMEEGMRQALGQIDALLAH
ncbi:MAG: SRPBCC family protein [Acidimicrobiales bacterium]